MNWQRTGFAAHRDAELRKMPLVSSYGNDSLSGAAWTGLLIVAAALVGVALS